MKRLLLSLALLAGCGLLADGDLPPQVSLVYPIAPTAGEIVIDGELGDAGWKNAVTVSGFTDSGSPIIANEQTSITMCYDNDFFYIAITCFESAMNKIHTSCVGHDVSFWEDDSIEIFIDENHDHSTLYQFAVTAGGATIDLRNGDSVWSATWKSAVKRLQDRWVVEVALPFAIFEHFEDKSHFEPTAGAVWGFNVCRDRRAGGKLELFNWADVQRNFHQAHLFGHLLYMPMDWKNNTELIAKAAAGAGRTENHLQIEDGFWLVPSKGGSPRKLTYAEAIVERFQKYPARVAELQEVFKDISIKEKDDFNAQLKEFDAWKAKTSGVSKVTSEEFALANIFYSSFVQKLDQYYWLAKLAKLNKEF